MPKKPYSSFSLIYSVHSFEWFKECAVESLKTTEAHRWDHNPHHRIVAKPPHSPGFIEPRSGLSSNPLWMATAVCYHRATVVKEAEESHSLLNVDLICRH